MASRPALPDPPDAQERLLELAKIAQVTGDPSAPVLHALADVADIPNDIERRIAPALARMETIAETIERAASRPLLTSEQIRWELIPAMLGTFHWFRVFFGAVMLVAAFAAGAAYVAWRQPNAVCEPTENGGWRCSYWLVQPQSAPPPQVDTPATPPPKQRH